MGRVKDHGHRAHMAVKPVKDKATRAKVAENEKNSPLLKLPPEIRCSVWRLVLGNRVIHIERSGFKGFMYEACLVEGFHGPGRWTSNSTNPTNPPNPSNQGSQSNLSEQSNAAVQSEVADTTQTNPGITDNSWEARHPSCLGLGKLSYAYSRQYITLDLLGVCHQIYYEGFEILWGTNLFSFTDSATFKSFLAILRLSQKRSLRNLQISLLDPRNGWVSGDVAKLHGLRTVELCIAENWLYDPGRNTKILDSLRKLPLEHVNVTVKLDDMAQTLGLTSIRTEQDRDELQQSYTLLLLPKDPRHNQSAQMNTSGTIITNQHSSTQDVPGQSDAGHSSSSHNIPNQGVNNNNQSNFDPSAVGQNIAEQSQPGQSSPIGNVVLPEGTN